MNKIKSKIVYNLILTRLRIVYFNSKIKNLAFKIKSKLINILLTENERCLITQGINEYSEAMQKDYSNGLICRSDFMDETLFIQRVKLYFKNDLWK